METFAYGRMFPHRGHDLSFHRFVPTNWALSQGLLQLLFLKSRKMIHPHVVLCVCVFKGFCPLAWDPFPGGPHEMHSSPGPTALNKPLLVLGLWQLLL